MLFLVTAQPIYSWLDAGLTIADCRTEQWSGLVTWYDGPNPWTRSGETFGLDTLTAAVDDALWACLAGQTVRVVHPDGGTLVVRINDTGWLARYGVALDLPKGTHQRLSGDGDTFVGIVEVGDEGGELVSARGQAAGGQAIDLVGVPGRARFGGKPGVSALPGRYGSGAEAGTMDVGMSRVSVHARGRR